MNEKIDGKIMHGGQELTFYLDETGRARWHHSQRPVPALTWEIYCRHGRPVHILGEKDPVEVGGSLAKKEDSK